MAITPNRAQEGQMAAENWIFKNWHESEWFDKNDGIYAEAYSAGDIDDYFTADVTRDAEGWYWMVKGTSKWSEAPELIDAGPAKSMHGARVKADRAARKSRNRRYSSICSRTS
jgi:hypothetical protein